MVLGNKEALNQSHQLEEKRRVIRFEWIIKSRGIQFIQYYSLHQYVFSPWAGLANLVGCRKAEGNKVEEQCPLQVPSETTTTIEHDDSAEARVLHGCNFSLKEVQPAHQANKYRNPVPPTDTEPEETFEVLDLLFIQTKETSLSRHEP